MSDQQDNTMIERLRDRLRDLELEIEKPATRSARGIEEIRSICWRRPMPSPPPDAVQGGVEISSCATSGAG